MSTAPHTPIATRPSRFRRLTTTGRPVTPQPAPAKGVPGIYCLLNLLNGYRYVGSGAGPGGVVKRSGQHFVLLSKNKHGNRHLQAAWNKYDAASFVIQFLETCSKDECLSREQYWLNYCEAANPKRGYNLSPTAGNTLGVRFSDETKNKIRRKAIGRKWSPEAKAKVSATLKGRQRTKHAMRGWDWTGRTHTDETKAKQSAYASNRPAEHRANLSESAMAKRLTEDHRRKIAASMTGKVKSEEARAKLRGQARTEQQRANIGAGVRRYWAARRAAV